MILNGVCFGAAVNYNFVTVIHSRYNCHFLIPNKSAETFLKHSEGLSYNNIILVVHKPNNVSQRIFSGRKPETHVSRKANVMYKIKDCEGTYTRQTKLMKMIIVWCPYWKCYTLNVSFAIQLIFNGVCLGGCGKLEFDVDVKNTSQKLMVFNTTMRLADETDFVPLTLCKKTTG